jgi:hypothetical protein
VGEDIDQSYSLAFGFDEIVAIGSSYKRADISTIVYIILFSYGVIILYPILQRAVKKVYELRSQKAASGPSRMANEGKRPGDELDESFGSQRRRLDDLTVNIE